MDWKPGHKIYGGGGYVIERKLGKGGFAIAYLARDERHEPIVIKTLREEILSEPKYQKKLSKFIKDFEGEGARLALFEHPNIVKIKGFFHEGNFPCICMEYIEGQDLGRRVENSGILGEAEALHYIQQIATALKVIHQKNLLHRDVKPQNIMIRSGTSEAVLIDFGIAREFICDVTQTHTQVLSHGFAPPEQYDRQAKRGAYSDVYGIAATLYYILTAEVPQAAYSRVVRDALIRPQHLNPNISDRVARAITIGMTLQAENRPHSIEQWLRLLELGTTPKIFSARVGQTLTRNSNLSPAPIPELEEFGELFDADDFTYLPTLAARPTPATPPPHNYKNNTRSQEDFFIDNEPPPKKTTIKIVPWFKVAKIALITLPIYLLIARFLAIYSVPNWLWFVIFISDINLKLYVIEKNNSDPEISNAARLFWILTTAIAAIGNFNSVYQATIISFDNLIGFLSGFSASFLFVVINLCLSSFLKQNLVFKARAKSLQLKKYYVLSLLVAISWFSLLIGWELWQER